jgi:phosphoglycolate phosphatase
MTTVLLWDIDGTLLTTGRAGIFAWEDAAEEVLGKKIDLAELNTSGLTDVEVAVRIVETVLESENRESGVEKIQRTQLIPPRTSPYEGGDSKAEIVKRLLRSYEKHLPGSLPKKQGRVLPGVREILEDARKRTNVLIGLLTGNTRAGAQAKLSYYGLNDYFHFGAFSDDTTDRPSIARKALELARERAPGLTLDRVFVIGDTPHDIHCGQAIGARTIAVAFPPYTVEALAELQPWWVLEKLPEPGMFFEKIFPRYSCSSSPSSSRTTGGEGKETPSIFPLPSPAK